jgi:hypothetical protein
VSVVAPIPKPVVPAPTESAPAAPVTRGGKVKGSKTAAAAPVAPVAPIVEPVSEMNHIDKANSKARRAEVLKTINDALTGKLKAPKQRGGMLRVLS